MVVCHRSSLSVTPSSHFYNSKSCTQPIKSNVCHIWYTLYSLTQFSMSVTHLSLISVVSTLLWLLLTSDVHKSNTNTGSPNHLFSLLFVGQLRTALNIDGPHEYMCTCAVFNTLKLWQTFLCVKDYFHLPPKCYISFSSNYSLWPVGCDYY